MNRSKVSQKHPKVTDPKIFEVLMRGFASKVVKTQFLKLYFILLKYLITKANLFQVLNQENCKSQLK